MQEDPSKDVQKMLQHSTPYQPQGLFLVPSIKFSYRDMKQNRTAFATTRMRKIQANLI